MVATLEDDNDHPLSGIMRLATLSRNTSKGPALFIFKAMLISTVSASIFGLGAAMLAPPLMGPGFSCMLGMGAGFVGGLVHRWRVDLVAAENAMQEFPELMQYHVKQILMNSEGYKSQEVFELQQWRSNMGMNMKKQGFAIAAVYAASDALTAIRAHQEQKLIEMYTTGADM